MSRKSLYQNREYPTNGEAVDQYTAENVEAIVALEETAKTKRTRSEMIADAIARFCGSMTFGWLNVILFLCWVLLNTLPGIQQHRSVSIYSPDVGSFSRGNHFIDVCFD